MQSWERRLLQQLRTGELVEKERMAKMLHGGAVAAPSFRVGGATSSMSGGGSGASEHAKESPGRASGASEHVKESPGGGMDFDICKQTYKTDDKYKDQIHAACRLLSECVGSEMKLEETIKKNRTIFSNFLGFSWLDGLDDHRVMQAAERANAIEMLNVLNRLVQEDSLNEH